MEQTQENPDSSINDLVAQAFEEFEKSLAEEDTPATEAEVVETPEVEDTPEEVEVEVEAPEAAAEVDTESDDDDQSEAETEEAEAGVVKPTANAPSSWSKGTKALYAALPEDIKKEVHKRESDFHAGLRELKPKADFADRVAVALQPYQATLNQLQQQGVDAPMAINKLLQADHILRYSNAEQKANYLAELAVQYGVDINKVASAPRPDPNVIAMRQQLEHLQQQRLQEQQASQMQQQSQMMSEIQRFSSDPKNEHFNVVRDDMAALLDTGKAATLQEAYDKAVWMRPEIRQTLLKRRETEARQKTLADTQRKRAKTASVSVSGNQSGKPGKPASADIRGILESLVPNK